MKDDTLTPKVRHYFKDGKYVREFYYIDQQGNRVEKELTDESVDHSHSSEESTD